MVVKGWEKMEGRWLEDLAAGFNLADKVSEKLLGKEGQRAMVERGRIKDESIHRLGLQEKGVRDDFLS